MFFHFTEAVVNDANNENKVGTADVSASQHVMVCALQELGSLVQSLNSTASPLIQDPSIGNCIVSKYTYRMYIFYIMQRYLHPMFCGVCFCFFDL